MSDYCKKCGQHYWSTPESKGIFGVYCNNEDCKDYFKIVEEREVD